MQKDVSLSLMSQLGETSIQSRAGGAISLAEYCCMKASESRGGSQAQ